MPTKLGYFFVQYVFPTKRQVLAGKLPSHFKDKQTRFRNVLQMINQNKLLITRLNLFLDDFKWIGRRINKKHKIIGKNKLYKFADAPVKASLKIKT